jgi:hypothetical protein
VEHFRFTQREAQWTRRVQQLSKLCGYSAFGTGWRTTAAHDATDVVPATDLDPAPAIGDRYPTASTQGIACKEVH